MGLGTLSYRHTFYIYIGRPIDYARNVQKNALFIAQNQ